jgi:hypothetical protein
MAEISWETKLGLEMEKGYEGMIKSRGLRDRGGGTLWNDRNFLGKQVGARKLVRI